MGRTIAMHLSPRRLSAVLLSSLLMAAQGLAGQALVYQVSHDGGPPSYLAGTMHSEDPRVTGLLGDLAPLVEQADIVALEMVPDAVTMLAVGAATLLPRDQSLRRLIGDDRFDALMAAATQRGLPLEVVDRLKPWAPAVQLVLLDEMVKNVRELPRQMEGLTAAYLSGDLDRIDGVAREQYGDMPPAVRRWFDEYLLDRRNARMLTRLSALLGERTVFVAVGALHLGGESGLIAGLRRLGYRVERWQR